MLHENLAEEGNNFGKRIYLGVREVTLELLGVWEQSDQFSCGLFVLLKTLSLFAATGRNGKEKYLEDKYRTTSLLTYALRL